MLPRIHLDETHNWIVSVPPTFLTERITSSERNATTFCSAFRSESQLRSERKSFRNTFRNVLLRSGRGFVQMFGISRVFGQASQPDGMAPCGRNQKPFRPAFRPGNLRYRRGSGRKDRISRIFADSAAVADGRRLKKWSATTFLSCFQALARSRGIRPLLGICFTERLRLLLIYSSLRPYIPERS